MRQFIRNAELYGTEGVYEVAEAERWGYEDLGKLAMQLRRIDSKWRLSAPQRQRMIGELVASDMPVAKIARLAGVSRTTVWKARRDAGSDVHFQQSRQIGSTPCP